MCTRVGKPLRLLLGPVCAAELVKSCCPPTNVVGVVECLRPPIVVVGAMELLSAPTNVVGAVKPFSFLLLAFLVGREVPGDRVGYRRPIFQPPGPAPNLGILPLDFVCSKGSPIFYYSACLAECLHNILSVSRCP